MTSLAYNVNSAGEVWTYHEEGGGELLSPAGVRFAQDIGVGKDGSVWVITNEARPGGFAPAWLQDPAAKKWVTLAAPAAVTDVSVL